MIKIEDDSDKIKGYLSSIEQDVKNFLQSLYLTTEQAIKIIKRELLLNSYVLDCDGLDNLKKENIVGMFFSISSLVTVNTHGVNKKSVPYKWKKIDDFSENIKAYIET